MAMHKTAIGATVLVAAVLLTTIVLALTQTASVTNNGTIKTIGVKAYQDSGCTIPLTSWTWGPLDIGSSTLKTMYIKNDGTVPMTLNMTTTSWSSPNAQTYIPVTWNREGIPVNAGASVQANVTLQVLAGISVSNFSFTMIITGTG